jgi:hypothetical protein
LTFAKAQQSFLKAHLFSKPAVFKYGRKNVLSFKTTKTGLLRVAMA